MAKIQADGASEALVSWNTWKYACDARYLATRLVLIELC